VSEGATGWRLAPDSLWRRVADTVVVLGCDQETPSLLRGGAASVWIELAERGCLAEADLAALAGAPDAAAVETLLADLAGRSAVERC
jgi:hypothetical protein